MLDFYFRNFKLGAIYRTNIHRSPIVKFIQVTPKGFNLLDETTNKCILKHHLYSRTWANKELPQEYTVIPNVRVYYRLLFKEIEHIIGEK